MSFFGLFPAYFAKLHTFKFDELTKTYHFWNLRSICNLMSVKIDLYLRYWARQIFFHTNVRQMSPDSETATYAIAIKKSEFLLETDKVVISSLDNIF